MYSIKSVAAVDFTHAGWNSLQRVNHQMGRLFLSAFEIRRELGSYIAAHEAAGIHLDTICQEIRYDDGIYLLVRRTQGVWYVTDVILAEAPDGFAPVMGVRQVWLGMLIGLEHFVIGWQGVFFRLFLNKQEVFS